jgi:hypothetical protein
VRERLRLLWLDPMALDPARASARVTREVAARLAALARELEAAGHPAEQVAAFLTRCLFSMFAEDVGLLPKGASGEGGFAELLRRHRDDPETLRQMLRVLWTDLDRGGFSPALAPHLTRAHTGGLPGTAAANWRAAEPAIFGTLLGRSLDLDERHALGLPMRQPDRSPLHSRGCAQNGRDYSGKARLD